MNIARYVCTLFLLCTFFYSIEYIQAADDQLTCRDRRMPDMPVNDKFNYAFQRHRDIYFMYERIVFAHMVSISVAIGWILTSRESREYLHDHRCVWNLSVSTILIFILLSPIFYYFFYSNSQASEDYLSELRYGREIDGVVASYTLTIPRMLWSLFVLFMSFVLFALLLISGKRMRA